jgi:hypothetical protein
MIAQFKSLFKSKKSSTKGNSSILLFTLIVYHSLFLFISIEMSLEDKLKTKDFATRIVEEENERKNQMPQYPGLERFEIIEKIGE